VKKRKGTTSVSEQSGAKRNKKGYQIHDQQSWQCKLGGKAILCNES